jgi:Mrp family chromosome partitioning ATPase
MTTETINPSTLIDVPQSWRPDAKVSACFRTLYQQMLLQSSAEEPLRAVGVTSCRRGEGVSTVASRLAIAAAEDGEQKVLLVDASSRVLPSSRTREMDPTSRPENEFQPLDQFLQPSPLENLWILSLAAAFPPSPPVEPQRSVHELLRDLSFEFSFIVVDLPPVDELGDRIYVTSAVDGMLLVVEAECTRRSLARTATVALSQSRLLGAVLNKRQESGPTERAYPTN